MLEDLKKEIKTLYRINIENEKNIGSQLHNINQKFLAEYKLIINKMEIIPLETEIYYGIKKEDDDKDFIFYDGMIHGDPLQKNRFGQLYFHRYKNNRRIKHSSGGVDVCISLDEKDMSNENFPYKNYYLSILLRSILIKEKDKEEQFVSGVNTIQEWFYYNEISRIVSALEEKQDIIKIDKDKHPYEIYSQKRIQNGECKENDEFENLNSFILGTKDDRYKYLEKSKLKTKTIEAIKDNLDSQEVKNGR